MRFVESALPVLVSVGGKTQDPSEFDEMVRGFETYFARGERYALITYTPEGSEMPGASARKRIAAWANQPRIREISARLCVASAAVVPSTLSRGVMTALLWLWKPASPLHLIATPEEAVDWCLDRLAEARVPVPLSRAEVHAVLNREAFASSR